MGAPPAPKTPKWDPPQRFCMAISAGDSPARWSGRKPDDWRRSCSASGRRRTEQSNAVHGVPCQPVWLGWVGLGLVGLGWVGLGWVGLGWLERLSFHLVRIIIIIFPCSLSITTGVKRKNKTSMGPKQMEASAWRAFFAQARVEREMLG